MAPTWEVRLSDPAIRSARFTTRALFALGALNAWYGQAAGDYGAVSTGLCFCVCAAGLFGEDLLQRGYRADRAVLAYVAAHPGATTRRVAQAITVGLPSASLREISTGLRTTACWRSPRMAFPGSCAPIDWPSPTASLRRRRVRDAARNIDHDRRLAKPVILTTIEEFAAAALGGGAAVDAVVAPELGGRRAGCCPRLHT